MCVYVCVNVTWGSVMGLGGGAFIVMTKLG